MKGPSIDTEKLRVALRRMNRGHLLMIAERAIEIVPKAKLRHLVGDMIRLNDLEPAKQGAVPLLDEVQEFQRACLRREYYEDFDVNSKNCMDQSKGTEAFFAEFDRLIGKCVKLAPKGPPATVREAFDVLFGLLRLIDEDPDRIVFFADEGGSWQVGVDWRAVLPAYLRCLADSASADEFAREVDRSIEDFCRYDRPRLLASARRLANAEQKAALRRLPAGKKPAGSLG